MTCIVGLVDNGNVYIGGDSAGVQGWDLVVRADEKVFRNGPMVMGFTDSFRMGQLLRYAFQVPDHDPRDDIDKYMVVTFVNAVRQCLKDGGYARAVETRESGGTFLVGYAGQLFCIDSDYQVAKAADGFAAVGCGSSYALGSLYSTEGQEPRIRVAKALAAAERFSAGVRAPFVVEWLER